MNVNHPQSTSKSRIWGAEIPEPIATELYLSSAVHGVITDANFGEDRLRGFGVARVEFWPYPLTCFAAFTTLSHYACECVIGVIAHCFFLAPCQIRLSLPNVTDCVFEHIGVVLH